MAPSLKAAETDIDFYEDDGYLAGLADQFIVDKRIDVDRVVLRETTNQAILGAPDADPALLEYWHKMVAVARSLSVASGVPFSFE